MAYNISVSGRVITLELSQKLGTARKNSLAVTRKLIIFGVVIRCHFVSRQWRCEGIQKYLNSDNIRPLESTCVLFKPFCNDLSASDVFFLSFSIAVAHSLDYLIVSCSYRKMIIRSTTRSSELFQVGPSSHIL